MKELKLYTIYKITNIITGKFYFGQTSKILPEKRFNEHLLVARGGPEKYPTRFKRVHYSIRKHGANNFTFETIEQCYGLLTANEIEKYYIALYKTNICRYENKFGYNMTDGGDGREGSETSEETKKKLSKALKGKYAGENHWSFGIPLTIEHKEKISKANIGKTQTEETKRHLRKVNLGENNPNFGKTMSEEAKQKRAPKVSGENNCFWNKPHTLEVREKQSKSHLENPREYKHTEEKISKIKDARKNQDMTYRIPIEHKEQIILLFNSGKYTRKDLAIKFGLTSERVGKIIYRWNIRQRKDKS